MENGERRRKAVGSSNSNPRGCQRRNAFSGSQPKHSREWHRLYPYCTEKDEIRTRIRLPSGQPQAPTHRMSESSTSHPRKIEHSQDDCFASAYQLTKETSTISDEWDMLERDDVKELPATASDTPSSYNFPGTWPAALHDTTTALTSVTSATASYATALTQSGIGKASWSVGAALASTANKRALHLVNWAVDHTGTGVDQLPRPIGGWLKSGRERWRKEKNARGGKEEPMFGDERGMFVLQTAEMDSTGEFVSGLRAVDEEKGWAETNSEGGSVVEGRGHERHEDDDEAERDGEDDGMIRLFEFDH